MPEYRKTFRVHYKILDEKKGIVTVENKLHGSQVTFTKDNNFTDGILLDDAYSPCTEEEFNAAKSEAMKRLQSERI